MPPWNGPAPSWCGAQASEWGMPGAQIIHDGCHNSHTTVNSGVSGLVVKSIVAIDGPRVRFAADAIEVVRPFFFLLFSLFFLVIWSGWLREEGRRWFTCCKGNIGWKWPAGHQSPHWPRGPMGGLLFDHVDAIWYQATGLEPLGVQAIVRCLQIRSSSRVPLLSLRP